MRHVPRKLAHQVLRATRAFPAVIVTGPRRAGKTTLLRRLFPRAASHLLEDPDVIARVRADPRQFVDELRAPAILDEIQNVPELLNYLRTRIDAAPRRMGQWLLTGSQEAPLMRGVTESMAGRAAIFHLLPLSVEESPRVVPFTGGFPEVLARPSAGPVWFRSYVQTYLERDVRAVTAIRELALFRRFLALLATRCGQLLNRSDLAASLGVSVPTIGAWLSILETTSQIILLPPYFENFGKRLIKSPKVYFADTGLLCHLLGFPNRAALAASPFLGPVFENFVASEIVKHQLNAGHARALYWFRDQRGLEVDFVVPIQAGRVALVEAKATRTLRPAHAEPLLRLAAAMRTREVKAFVVHPSGDGARGISAIAPGVKSVDLRELLAALR